MANEKIYQMVTERVIQKIQDAIHAVENGELGIAPWRRPWFQAGLPLNLVSKRPYRGINVFLLSALGYASPYFVSYNQAKKLGGSVKPGEKGCPVIFWKVSNYEKDKDGNPYGVTASGKPIVKTSWLLRYYTVFNVSQCEGFEDKIPELPTRVFNPIQDGDRIIDNMPNRPTITHNEARAYYRPACDTVNMPKHELFNSDGEYYSTAFHELVHSTGHASRLNRDEVTNIDVFGSHTYSTEELVAEMGSVYLCNEIGLDAMFDNSLAYLKSWLDKLKDDVKMLVVASGKAQKAVDYILGTKAENYTTDDE